MSVAEDARALTVESDGHAFDAVGGFDALHERHFAQGFEHLRPLAGVKHLLALDFGEVVEQSVGAHRHGEVTQAMIAEGHHGIRSIRFQIHLPRQQTPES